jgi:transposase
VKAARTVLKGRGRRKASPLPTRGLRSAVIYRKLSLGSQSQDGEQRVARLLSAHTTCRLQHRSLFAHLTDAITAHARGHPAPLLS